LVETKWYWLTVTILAVLIGGTWYFLQTSDKYDVCRKGNTYGDWYNISETIFVDNKFSAVGKYRCDIEDLELWCARVSGTRCYYVLEETSIPTGFDSVAEHGRTWDRTCDGNTCTISLKSGVVNVFEEGRWKKIQEAKSLKDKGFEVIYLENDPGLKIQIMDFNYTWIKFRFIVEDVKHLKQMLPVKVNKVKVKNFLWNNVGDVREYEIFVDNILDYNFSLGKNSTTIQLQDNVTDNLMDTFVRSDSVDSNYGTSTALSIKDRAAGIYRTYVMFDISTVPASQIIDNAELCLNMFRNGLTGSTSAYHITDNTLDGQNETTVTWNNQVCGTGFDDSGDCNLTVADTQTCDDTGWWCWTLTNGVTIEYTETDNNVSVALKSDDESNNYAADQYYSSEWGTESVRPYLNITYSTTGDTCACSSIQGGTPIDCSDNCDIEACDVAGADIQFTGAGTITVAGDVTNIGYTTFSIGCAVELCPTCQWG